MSAEHLRYSGKVLAVEDTYAEIEIHEACGDGCGSCHLSSFCGGHGTSVMLKAEYDKDGSADVHEVIPLGITLDERIADGYYYSKTVRLLKHLLEHPELLELPLDEKVDY